MAGEDKEKDKNSAQLMFYCSVCEKLRKKGLKECPDCGAKLSRKP